MSSKARVGAEHAPAEYIEKKRRLRDYATGLLMHVWSGAATAHHAQDRGRRCALPRYRTHPSAAFSFPACPTSHKNPDICNLKKLTTLMPPVQNVTRVSPIANEQNTHLNTPTTEVFPTVVVARRFEEENSGARFLNAETPQQDQPAAVPAVVANDDNDLEEDGLEDLVPAHLFNPPVRLRHHYLDDPLFLHPCLPLQLYA